MVSHKGEVKIHSSTLVSRLLVELFFIDNTLNKPSLKDFKFSVEIALDLIIRAVPFLLPDLYKTGIPLLSTRTLSSILS